MKSLNYKYFCTKCADTGVILAKAKYKDSLIPYGFRCPCGKNRDRHQGLPQWTSLHAYVPQWDSGYESFCSLPEYYQEGPLKEELFKVFRLQDFKTHKMILEMKRYFTREDMNELYKHYKEETGRVPGESVRGIIKDRSEVDGL